MTNDEVDDIWYKYLDTNLIEELKVLFCKLNFNNFVPKIFLNIQNTGTNRII